MHLEKKKYKYFDLGPKNSNKVDYPDYAHKVAKKVKLNKNIYIVKNIKSRIIMKDGMKIVDIAKSIQAQKSTKKYLATTAPVCSKTKKYLEENQIKTVFNYIIS